MMSDLQDPVELISDMIKEWKNGKQIVLLQKRSNTDKFILRIFKNLYYKFINKLSMHSSEKNIIGSGLMIKK